MGFSIERRTKSARLTVTTGDGQTIVIENLAYDRGFRMSFSAKRVMNGTPGEFTVTIYNLPPAVLGALQSAQIRKVDDLDGILVGAGLQSAVVASDGADATAAGFMIVELEAGYDGVLSRVFRAIGARVKSFPDSNLTSSVTTITASENMDGSLLALPLACFPFGAQTYDVIDYLRQLAGLGPGNLSPSTITTLLGDNSTLDQSWCASGGHPLDLMDSVLKYMPMRWFIDDREFWVCGRDDVSFPDTMPPYVPDEICYPDILLAPPQRQDGGYIQAECLLCPRLRVGRIVVLTEGGLAQTLQGLSPSLQEIIRAQVPPGQYRLDEVSHQGDTGPGTWSSKMLMKPITTPIVGEKLGLTDLLLLDLEGH